MSSAAMAAPWSQDFKKRACTDDLYVSRGTAPWELPPWSILNASALTSTAWNGQGCSCKEEQAATPKNVRPELPAYMFEIFESVTELIGRGSFSAVWRLKEKKTGKAYALKIVDKHPLHIQNLLPQLTRGLRIQGSLQHRNILQLVSVFQDASYFYLVLDHCAGVSLRTLCAQQPCNRLEEVVAARYVAQICKGLDFMHKQTYVHRCLKPENVLLDADDEVRICDFGWSAEVGTILDLRGFETPHRWPPELFEGKTHDLPVDLWALGTLSYELLVGHSAFWGNMRELRRKVLSAELLYPPGLFSIEATTHISSLIRRDPKKRVSAGQLLAEHPWVRGGLGLTCDPGIRPSTRREGAAATAAALNGSQVPSTPWQSEAARAAAVNGTQSPIPPRPSAAATAIECVLVRASQGLNESTTTARDERSTTPAELPPKGSDIGEESGQDIDFSFSTLIYSGDVSGNPSADPSREETSESDGEHCTSRGKSSDSDFERTSASKVLESSSEAAAVTPVLDSDSSRTPEMPAKAIKKQIYDSDSTDETSCTIRERCGTPMISDEDKTASDTWPLNESDRTSVSPPCNSESSPEAAAVTPVFDSGSGLAPELPGKVIGKQASYVASSQETSDSDRESCGAQMISMQTVAIKMQSQKLNDDTHGPASESPQSSPEISPATPVFDSDSSLPSALSARASKTQISGYEASGEDDTSQEETSDSDRERNRARITLDDKASGDMRLDKLEKGHTPKTTARTRGSNEQASDRGSEPRSPMMNARDKRLGLVSSSDTLTSVSCGVQAGKFQSILVASASGASLEYSDASCEPNLGVEIPAPRIKRKTVAVETDSVANITQAPRPVATESGASPGAETPPLHLIKKPVAETVSVAGSTQTPRSVRSGSSQEADCDDEKLKLRMKFVQASSGPAQQYAAEILKLQEQLSMLNSQLREQECLSSIGELTEGSCRSP